MKFDGLILDVDGTIWNTTDVVAKAWNKAIDETFSNVNHVSGEDLKKQFGKTMKVIADNLFGNLLEEQKNQLLELCCKYEQKAILKNRKKITYQGVVQTIKEISKCIPVFIVSNCQSGYIEVVMKKNKITDFITDFECYGNNKKNKDENIKLIVQRNNLQNPVYVGDTQGDYEACKLAGVPFIWASYGFGKIDEKDILAEINEFSQIKNIIFNNKNSIPIVFCHGLMGWKSKAQNGIHYFVAVEKLKNKNPDLFPRFIFSSTGPFSSLHDQVCELFFQLKGGLTDYGEEHSKEAGHNRYSRRYDNPEYPEWDSEHPLHFVGHSMGAGLIRLLQYYLEEDYFYKFCGFSEHTNANWIRSVTTIAGVHNGSTMTWILGADEKTGILKDNAKIVRFISKLLEKIGKKQNRKKNKDFIYDLHLDQWKIENNSDVKKVINQMASKIGYEGKDNALYDLTPNAFLIYNSYLKEYPCTYYFSFMLKTSFSVLNRFCFPIPFVTHLILFLNVFLMGIYKVKSSEWKKYEILLRKNDGMCPTESEKYPFIGIKGKPNYVDFSLKNQNVKKGIWNCIKNPMIMDHSEPTMMPHLLKIKKSMKFYKKIINIITNLD